MLGKWNPDLVDFLIVYLAPDYFYVIPVKDIPAGQFNICFFPFGQTSRKAARSYDHYRDCWNLLKKS
tara:strand:+ start:1159 stop:1359 length:201 start_codon:yes stop_codon:yes gene_type:complete